MVIAGLAGTTNHMRSASVLSLAQLLHLYSDKMDSNYIDQLVPAITSLINTGSRELIKSCTIFIKICLAVLPVASFKLHLSLLLTTLSNMSKENKQHFKLPLRRILEKLIRKYSYNTVLSLVPNEDHKLLNHIRKMESRKKKKLNSTTETKLQSFDDLINDNGSENEEDSLPEKPNSNPKKSKKNNHKNDTFLMESDDPIDFFDPKSISHLRATAPTLNRKRSRLEGNDEGEDDTQSDFPLTEDGKLVILSSSAEKKEPTLDDMIIEQEREFDAKQYKKRKINDVDMEEDDVDIGNKNMKYEGERNRKDKEKTSTSEKHTGKEYKASKAKGDVKKSGKLDPYAYLPLDPRFLNRRQKVKAKRQFDNIIHAAKRGSSAVSKTHKVSKHVTMD